MPESTPAKGPHGAVETGASAPSGCIDMGGGGTLCMGPAMEEVRREDQGERWCFVCRKRRPFTLTVSVPVGMSYYGPSAAIRCDRGHDDGDLFPGRWREWEEAG